MQLTLSPQALAMLDQLLRTGLYGIHGRAGVAQELIYKGLREIEKPLLSLERGDGRPKR